MHFFFILKLKRYEGVLYASKSQLEQNVTLSSFVSGDVLEAKTLIAMSLTLYVGIFQVRLKSSFHLMILKCKF
jgi:hypothetical protein